MAMNCPSFLLPHPQKGCGSGMWPWSLCTITSPGEMEQAAGDLHPTLHLGEGDGVGRQGWGVRGPGALVPTHGEQFGGCPRSPAVCTAGPDEPTGWGKAWPHEDRGPKQLLERGAGLVVLELTGPGRDLVI